MPTVVHPNSRSLGAPFGVLALSLSEGRYAFQFVPIAGQTFSDSGSGGCHHVNAPPAVSAGPDAKVPPGLYTLHASFTDTQNDAPWTWTVDWGDGLLSASGSSTSQGAITASHAYALPGNYTVRVSVTDSKGATGSASLVLTVAIL